MPPGEYFFPVPPLYLAYILAHISAISTGAPHAAVVRQPATRTVMLVPCLGVGLGLGFGLGAGLGLGLVMLVTVTAQMDRQVWLAWDTS